MSDTDIVFVSEIFQSLSGVGTCSSYVGTITIGQYIIETNSSAFARSRLFKSQMS
ncbi:MAG TPA: hypothetical protein VF884_12535 [Nitrososphaeraceae archaeon]